MPPPKAMVNPSTSVASPMRPARNNEGPAECSAEEQTYLPKLICEGDTHSFSDYYHLRSITSDPSRSDLYAKVQARLCRDQR